MPLRKTTRSHDMRMVFRRADGNTAPSISLQSLAGPPALEGDFVPATVPVLAEVQRGSDEEVGTVTGMAVSENDPGNGRHRDASRRGVSNEDEFDPSSIDPSLFMSTIESVLASSGVDGVEIGRAMEDGSDGDGEWPWEDAAMGKDMNDECCSNDGYVGSSTIHPFLASSIKDASVSPSTTHASLPSRTIDSFVTLSTIEPSGLNSTIDPSILSSTIEPPVLSSSVERSLPCSNVDPRVLSSAMEQFLPLSVDMPPAASCVEGSYCSSPIQPSFVSSTMDGSPVSSSDDPCHFLPEDDAAAFAAIQGILEQTVFNFGQLGGLSGEDGFQNGYSL